MYEETLIKVEGLYKKFCKSLKRSMFYGILDISRSMFGIRYDTSKLRRNEFWALEDINFEVRKGEKLGIIGVNGSGKSTLLRLISGIFPPDAGKINVRGQIGSLIAVGAGFHPHMTGKENIFLNGAILGMNKDEIKSKYDRIVDFADIGDFLEAPVATYSSGMRVRLGFAIAIHCEPNILLVDEILSVGDLSFRNKSLRYMSEYREKASALIFVSHNLEQVRVLCNRVIILDHGKVIFDGDTHQGCIKYEEMIRTIRIQTLTKEHKRMEDGNLKLKARMSSFEDIDLIGIGVLDEKNKITNEVKLDAELKIFVDFRMKKFVEDIFFSVTILNEEHKTCIRVVSNDNNKVQFRKLSPNLYRLKVLIENHHLSPNVYIPAVAIRNSNTGELYEKILPNCSFKVVSDGERLERGIVAVDEKWSLEKQYEDQ